MAIYMYQGRYTQGAIRNLVGRPEDRSKAAAALIKAVGGKLLHFYMSFGDYDFVAIAEYPSDEAAMASSMAVGSVGHVSEAKTTKLMTTAEAMKAMAAAGAAAKAMAPPKGK
jgi:uncharacterized protein with GYD domain